MQLIQESLSSNHGERLAQVYLGSLLRKVRKLIKGTLEEDAKDKEKAWTELRSMGNLVTPGFVGARDVYDPAIRELVMSRAAELGIRAVEGVYGAMSGPAYETPAEIEMLRRLGATVVGMSVVPEAMPARALGMRVVGLASVTNVYGEDVRHEDVVRVSNETAAAIGRLLVDLCPRMTEGA